MSEPTQSLTQETLDHWVAKWQKILQLLDWDFRIGLKRSYDLHNNSAGCCDMLLSQKTSYISVLDPHDYPDNMKWPHDPEEVVVHELLHAHFESFMPETETLQYTAAEQAINAIARALVALDRTESSRSRPLA